MIKVKARNSLIKFFSFFLISLLLIGVINIPISTGDVKQVSSPGQYTYDPGNRKDPFKPLTSGGSAISKVTLPPLQRHEISELKVIGIVWGDFGYKAMVQASDGKGYTLSKGTLVGPNKGVVKRITKKSVIIEEMYLTTLGVEKKREVILELQSKEEILE